MDNIKKQKCYEIFNKYEEISEKFNQMAYSINHLKSSVQNPDFIRKDDFQVVADNESMVLKKLERDFNKCYGELLDLFKEVADIYGVNVEDYE